MVKMANGDVTCKRFIQNAWKRDFCSNCFKSREDHIHFADKKLTCNWKMYLESSPKQGILKGNMTNGKSRAHTVSFHNKESEIIGFGGDDDYSSDEDYFFAENEDVTTTNCSNQNSDFGNEEDDKEWQKLTQSNTDFNSISSNLECTDSNHIQKCFSKLKLGKPLVDSNGHRQTLQVSVEPFKDSGFSSLTSSRNIHLNNSLQEYIPNNNNNNNNNKTNENENISNKIENIGNDTKNCNDKSIHNCREKNEIHDYTNSKNNYIDTNRSTNCSDRNNTGYVNNAIKINENINPEKKLPDNVQVDIKMISSIRELENTDNADSNRNDEVTNTCSKEDECCESNPKTDNNNNNNYEDISLDNDKSKNDDYNIETYEINETVNRENIYLKYTLEENRHIDTDAITELSNINLYKKENERNTKDNYKKVKIDDSVSKRQIVPPKNIDATNQDLVKSRYIQEHCSKEIKENIRNAKNKLEPLFRLGFATEYNMKKKKYKNYTLDDNHGGCYHLSTIENGDIKDSHFTKRKEPQLSNFYEQNAQSLNSPKMVCNILNLPLITSKEFIEFNKSTSGEMVGKDLSIEIDKPGSREMVGEPDGKADSDDPSDPPSLQNIAAEIVIEPSLKNQSNEDVVPANPQKSFLHDFNREKPKIAVKPIALLQNHIENRCTYPANNVRALSSDTSKHNHVNNSDSCSDVVRSTKRPAPQPPSSPSLSLMSDDTMQNQDEKSEQSNDQRKKDSRYVIPRPSELILKTPESISKLLNHRNSDNCEKLNFKIVSNEMENLENGSYRRKNGDDLVLCQNGYSTPTGQNTSILERNALTMPNRSVLSLSYDSIIPPNANCFSEKGRRYNGAATKVRYTIRKILRLNTAGSNKYDDTDVMPNATPRKRLEIIHPLDLNKSAVEVVGKNTCTGLLRKEQWSEQSQQVEQESKTECLRRASSPGNHHILPPGRPNKPPPPPRSQSLDFSISKPMRPPLPKSNHILHQAAHTKLNSGLNDDRIKITTNNAHDVEPARQNSITPVKPQRTASIRERLRNSICENDNSQINSRVSSPECESTECDNVQGQTQNSTTNEQELSESPSIIYCGSETESDICYQSVTLSSDDSIEDEGDTTALNALNMRKRRSVLHSSLEDNYGAVVIANHEALSQLLEQVNHVVIIPSSLKMLQSSPKLRWQDFSIVESSLINVADWKFYNAKWNNNPVVISISTRHNASVNSLPVWITLVSVVEFTDVIPSKYIKDNNSEETIQAYITVWNEEHMESIDAHSKQHENNYLQAGLITVQLMNALKCLQACGIEETYLHAFILCKDEAKSMPKLRILPTNMDSVKVDPNVKESDQLSLCKCVLKTLNLLLASHRITNVINKILSDEKATSLSQAKAIMEYWLWGPADVTLSENRLTTLQRWLDLERATLLHKLVCSRSLQLSCLEQCHLMFLVRTNSKTLSDASILLETQNTN